MGKLSSYFRFHGQFSGGWALHGRWWILKNFWGLEDPRSWERRSDVQGARTQALCPSVSAAALGLCRELLLASPLCCEQSLTVCLNHVCS